MKEFEHRPRTPFSFTEYLNLPWDLSLDNFEELKQHYEKDNYFAVVSLFELWRKRQENVIECLGVNSSHFNAQFGKVDNKQVIHIAPHLEFAESLRDVGKAFVLDYSQPIETYSSFTSHVLPILAEKFVESNEMLTTKHLRVKSEELRSVMEQVSTRIKFAIDRSVVSATASMN